MDSKQLQIISTTQRYCIMISKMSVTAFKFITKWRHLREKMSIMTTNNQKYEHS